MRLERLTWVEAEAYFKAHDMVILSNGSIESHGRHNALGVDYLIPLKLLELIEEKTDALIVPTLPYGDGDWHMDFPGTVSIGSELLEAVMKRICSCLIKWGARRFVFINGHGGNSHALEKACGYLDANGAIGAIVNWWIAAGELNPAWKGGHGAGEETAAMLAVDPSLVHMDEITDAGLKPPTPELIPSGLSQVAFRGVHIPLPRTSRQMSSNGWFGDDHPANATLEWGNEMLQATADFIVDYMAEFAKIPIRAGS